MLKNTYKKYVFKNIVLPIVTRQHIRSPELIHLITEGLDSLTDQDLPISSIPQPLVSTILLSVYMSSTLIFHF